MNWAAPCAWARILACWPKTASRARPTELARDQRAPSPSLRIQPRIRSRAEAAWPAPDRRNSRRRLRRDLRAARTIPGIWAASSIPSSSPSRWSRIRLFRAFIGAALEHRRRKASHRRLRGSRDREACHRLRPCHRLNIGSIRGSICIGGDAPLALIAGPCVIESEEHVHFLVPDRRCDRQARRARSSSRRPSTRPTGPASPRIAARV